jgi:D-sedoheptulose 7-phosphate isomerase
MEASEFRLEKYQQAITAELRASANTKEQMVQACAGAIGQTVEIIVAAIRKGNKILLCGNGGSAADAQHLATEFVIRMDPSLKRPGIPAIALTTDSSMLTAGSNDLGYESVFSRAVDTLGQPGDILVGISTSGKSESVNRALSTAKARGMLTIGFLGKGGGRAKDLVDIAIIIPSDDTQRIQEGHITAGHIICGLVERELYLPA